MYYVIGDALGAHAIIHYEDIFLVRIHVTIKS